MTRREFLGTSAALAALPQRRRPPAAARYIWYDAHGEGRNTFARFRKTFSVAGAVRSALLHVFADTTYQLFVNGEFVEFGPVRCDPRFPLYDTHDIAKLLRPGENTVLIEVNFWGLKTFKAMPVRGGLIAWGGVEHAGGAADFTTRAGSWQVVAPKSRARYAPKLSFALQAADLFEQTSGEEAWKPAVEIEKQDSWGELRPRSIPFMSGEPVAIVKPALVLPIERNEEWHSFSVPFPHHFEDDKASFSDLLAFSTWVYSPREQTVSAGVLYGSHRLNGVEVPKGTPSIDRPMRSTERWPLKQGWNELTGTVKSHYDPLDIYFAVPRGLAFSTDKDPASPYGFRYAFREGGDWVYVKRGDVAQSPCRETSWDHYGEPWQSIAPEALDGHTFRLADYPDGFALQFDLEWMHLVLPRVRLRGVRGATLDVTYTERLSPDREHVQQFSWYPVGDRALCTLDEIDWMPGNPRGARYCLLTVRNPRADVTLESFRLRSASYPVEHKGRFECSDPCLNEVWKMCERTQAANMEDAYVDCAGRERGLYVRDAIIQYHNNLATFGDQALMRRCVELFGQSLDTTGRFRIVYPNTGSYTYNDFSLNMVEGYRNYYDYSGDAARIREDWAAIRTNLDYFSRWSDRRTDLLLENLKELGGFGGDTETEKKSGADSGPNCFFSLTYLLALQSALRLARAIGKDDDARDLERRVAKLSASISSTFWDPRKKRFGDSVHANLFAVRAGAATPEQLDGIRAYVRKELRSPFLNGFDPSGGIRVSSHFSFYIFDGLYKAGLADVAENLMRQGWGYFLAQGARTTPEYFSMEQSLCHAWSASPVYYLSKYGLGIEFPEAPNLDTVRINVQAHSLTHAEGAWPHPRGLVEVKWHMEGARRVFDSVRAPAGVRVLRAGPGAL